jgi:hypothetical protein
LADKLLDQLSRVAAINSYHGQLLQDYIDFIRHLDALQRRFVIDWDNERENFFLGKSDVECLKSIRLRDLIDKLRYSQLEQRAGDALRSDGFPVSHEKLLNKRGGQPGLVLVSADMTRGVGLFDLKYLMNTDRLGNPVILGVQVQGNQFRLVVEARNKSKVREIARALWQQGGSKLWFDFGLLPDESEEYPKDKEFNQYSGVFFYRSKRLSSISPKCLIDTIVAYARSIRTDQTVIWQRIETVLQDGANHEP